RHILQLRVEGAGKERPKGWTSKDSAQPSASCFSECQRLRGLHRHLCEESMRAFGKSLAPATRPESTANTCRLDRQAWQNSCTRVVLETQASSSRAHSKMLNSLSI